MRSHVVSLADYRDIDLGPAKVCFAPDEAEVQRELQTVRVARATWEIAEKARMGDMVACALSSAEPSLNRRDLRLILGAGLFDARVEEALAGMHAGQAKTFDLGGAPVLAELIEVRRRVLPKLDDEEALRATAVARQREELLIRVAYDATAYALREVFSQSEILVTQDDWQHVVDLELGRFRTLAAGEGLELEQMDAADFEGKAPVSSYWELVALAQRDAWETIRLYAAGLALAQEDGFAVSGEDYERYLGNYMQTWDCSHGRARAITTFEHFGIEAYANHYYDTVHAFVKAHIIEED